MTEKNNSGCSPHARGISRKGGISRRDFLVAAATAAAGLLTGCGSAPQPDAAPTKVAAPSEVATPTDTAAPAGAPVVPTDVVPTKVAAPTDAPDQTATSEPVAEAGHPKVIQSHPDGPSRVVQAHHAGVWDSEALVPEALREMLDASITGLTGIDDAGEAWAALFGPSERIAIKVNTIRSSRFWTRVPLVVAVTKCLLDAGIPAEQIIVFDRNDGELRYAGFSDLESGVRCQGTGFDYDYESLCEVMGKPMALSKILTDCDALINIPILKAHGMSGISFAMKNHYGTVNLPGDLHADIGHALAELNALPQIKDRTRLIVGDVLSVVGAVSGGWNSAAPGDSILMSADPVAHDAVGLQLFVEAATAAGGNPERAVRLAAPWLEHGAALGLGTDDLEAIEWMEIDLV